MTGEILVVDDDEAIRQAVSYLLRNEGYSVQQCNDGRQMIDLLDGTYEPQLIILDVMMPRPDGRRLLRMVRNGELPVAESLPVILLTSRGREEDVTEGFESGADYYVTKPFRSDELVARVRTVLDE